MGYHATSLPDYIQYGSKAGPTLQNRVVELPDSGADEVVDLNSSPRQQFDVGYAIRSATDLAAVRTHWYGRKGSANTFPFKDWSDYCSTSSGTTFTQAISHQDVVIGVGDGVTTTFQLIKKYTSGSQTYTRTIRKPRGSTVIVALDTTQQTSGWSVDEATGLVMFTVAPTLGVQVKAGFEFWVPVRYGEEADRWLATTLVAFDQGTIESIPLIEQRDPGGDPEDRPMGGGANVGTVAANFFITQANGFAQSHAPSVGSLKGFLPETENLSDGGLYFHLRNAGSFSYDVRSASDVAVGTIPTSTTALISLVQDLAGVKTWLLK